MVKGFIFFRTGKIPFVIENYRMDLFTDDSLLEIFCKEYNFKENYYDFKNDRSSKYLMILLDKLIRCMSLKLIGFSNDDISNFMPFYP